MALLPAFSSKKENILLHNLRGRPVKSAGVEGDRDERLVHVPNWLGRQVEQQPSACYQRNVRIPVDQRAHVPVQIEETWDDDVVRQHPSHRPDVPLELERMDEDTLSNLNLGPGA